MQCLRVASDVSTSCQHSSVVVRGQCGRHFDQCVFAGLHSLDRHGRVPLPRRSDVNDIDVVPPQHVPVIVFAIAVIVGLRNIEFHEQLLRVLDSARIGIADRLNLDTVNSQQQTRHWQAAPAHADQSDPHGVEWRRRMIQHRSR